MPFSSDGDMIDYVYGVINWKDDGPVGRTASDARRPPSAPRRRTRR